MALGGQMQYVFASSFYVLSWMVSLVVANSVAPATFELALYQEAQSHLEYMKTIRR